MLIFSVTGISFSFSNTNPVFYCASLTLTFFFLGGGWYMISQDICKLAHRNEKEQSRPHYHCNAYRCDEYNYTYLPHRQAPKFATITVI